MTAYLGLQCFQHQHNFLCGSVLLQAWLLNYTATYAEIYCWKDTPQQDY